MKIKQFLQMGDICDNVEIIKDKQTLYSGTIEDYLKLKKSVNGVIDKWSMYVENWDYPIIQIIINND